MSDEIEQIERSAPIEPSVRSCPDRRGPGSLPEIVLPTARSLRLSDAEHMAIRDSMRRFSWARNPYATPDATYGPAQSRVLNAQGFERARDAITAWPGYAPTPLVNLSGIARLAEAVAAQ